MRSTFAGLLLLYSVVQLCIADDLRSGESSNSMEKEKIHSHILRQSRPHLSSRKDIQKLFRVGHDYIHEVMFVIKQRNMDVLTNILHDLSDPQSSNYGHHWTREEVADFTSNPEARDAVVSYLHSNGASIFSESLAGDYIKAKASIKVWEKMFNTEFFLYRGKSVGDVVRAEEYWLPKELDMHVTAVLQIVNMPISSPALKSYPLKIETDESKKSISALDWTQYRSDRRGYTTPWLIRKYYNMSFTTEGSAKSTQAIFSKYSQRFSPTNLKVFQTDLMQLSMRPVNMSRYNSSNDALCTAMGVCDEGNLDTQYLMSTSSFSPTTFWYTHEMFSGFLFEVANTVKHPLILTISWGAPEKYIDTEDHQSFTEQAIKLGTMGVTIFASSGDSGANYRGCGYTPIFPASNPYVTSVGGTAVSTLMVFISF